jgi:hypothetical protein
VRRGHRRQDRGHRQHRDNCPPHHRAFLQPAKPPRRRRVCAASPQLTRTSRSRARRPGAEGR